MKRGVWIAVFLVIVIPQGSFAADNHLNAEQQLGRRLFEQSCGVCHTRPTLISGMFGPELSRLNLGGQEDLLRKFISEGTARMPGFSTTHARMSWPYAASATTSVSAPHRTMQSVRRSTRLQSC